MTLSERGRRCRKRTLSEEKKGSEVSQEKKCGVGPERMTVENKEVKGEKKNVFKTYTMNSKKMQWTLLKRGREPGKQRRKRPDSPRGHGSPKKTRPRIRSVKKWLTTRGAISQKKKRRKGKI